MKIKILEHNFSSAPKFKYFGVRSILEIDIKDKLKFITLPVGVGAVNNPWDLNYVPSIASDLLIFHDGAPGVPIGYYSYAPELPYQGHIDRGSQYMYTLQIGDPYYAYREKYGVYDVSYGWTAGTPFDWFTEKQIWGWKEKLEKLGATPETKGYAYINWTEDHRDMLQFEGWKGPGEGMKPGEAGKVYVSSGTQIRSLEEYDRFQKAVAKHFIGGTASDTGEFVHGLRHYFPGISFGIYNSPRWWMNGDEMVYGDKGMVEDRIDSTAEKIVNHAPDFLDAVQMLMPDIYSIVNSAVTIRCRSAQGTMLAKKINEKLIARGKQPKQIIAFITPFSWTDHTGGPYWTSKYTVNSNSFVSKKYNVFKVNWNYEPPYTRLLSEDLAYRMIEPAIEEGADGAIIWMGQSYRLKQIAGRTLYCNPSPIPCYEDEVLSGPVLNPNGTPKLDAAGNLQWTSSWRKGITMQPTIWSEKDCWRQSISADLNYQAGVCMGITGNRWWYNELKGSTLHTPPEWLPLQGRERFGYGNQPIGSTGMSSPATIQLIDQYLTGVVTNTIEVWKSNWNRIRHGKK